MGKLVVNGAQLMCSQGMAPGALTVLRPTITAQKQPVANIMDHQPMANIGTFGMCRSLTNPQVVAATSAAMGTLTPQPCTPVTVAPWTGGAMKVTVENMPAVMDSSRCLCTWSGQISIVNPGTQTVDVS